MVRTYSGETLASTCQKITGQFPTQSSSHPSTRAKSTWHLPRPSSVCPIKEHLSKNYLLHTRTKGSPNYFTLHIYLDHPRKMASKNIFQHLRYNSCCSIVFAVLLSLCVCSSTTPTCMNHLPSFDASYKMREHERKHEGGGGGALEVYRLVPLWETPMRHSKVTAVFCNHQLKDVPCIYT